MGFKSLLDEGFFPYLKGILKSFLDFYTKMKIRKNCILGIIFETPFIKGLHPLYKRV